MSNKAASKPNPMTPTDQARIHSTQANAGGGQVKANSFAARAQRTVAVSQRAAKGNAK